MTVLDTQVRSETAIDTPSPQVIDMKLEVVVIPVYDVDRAKRFYGGLGWRLDADVVAGEDYRVVQFTPPGSACSIIFGRNVTGATPGSAQGLYLVVSDIEAARRELRCRGVEIGEAFHDAGGADNGTDAPYLFGRMRIDGPDRRHRSYRSFASFKDPDGNGWLLQEVTERLTGHLDADGPRPWSTEFEAAPRAAAAESEREEPTGEKVPDWLKWYAEHEV